MEQELVSGTIAAVVFENPENGYAVVKLDSDDGGLITVVGTIPAPAAGERLIVTGKWTAHATYGRQLEAEFLERLLPDSTAEIRAYLSSRAVRGVGPKTAEKIVAAFGTDSLKILETSPERLTEIDGISRKKALEIGASFRQQVAVRRLIEFLAGYRIPAQVAVRLYRVYGAQSLGRVQEDPYLLAQPQFGAGFGAADQLALELGFDGDDARRVEAGVIFELRHNLTNGHTFLPQDKLVAATSQLLSLEAEPVIAAVDRLTELGRVEHSTIAGIAAVYLPEYYEAETAIAARIRAMAQHPPAPLPDAERVLQGIEAIAGITYAERQRDAIRMAAERRIMILTGGPGTGKTTVLSGILTLFSKLGRKTLLAAPTGRAAKRLSELTGRDAATVHRLLEAQVSPENGEMFFARNEDEPLECDAVIVDEMSMVDVLLMHSLLEALPQEAGLTDADLDAAFAGDLLNQCIGSSFSLRNRGVPTLGLYGACSTMAESLLLAAMSVSGGFARTALAMTSSHFASSERQYRFPLGYGGQRTPTSQWTVTGAGAVLLGGGERGIRITAATIGSIVDRGICDANNMGAAMAPAAFATLRAHFDDLHCTPEDYDVIITGDLGRLGSEILHGLLEKDGIRADVQDCGVMIFDAQRQDVHCGGSGCGCSASVLCGPLLSRMERGELRRLLFCGTGALLSPLSTQQGESIPAVCHAVVLERS